MGARNVGQPLACVAFLDKFDSIAFHARPVVALPFDFKVHRDPGIMGTIYPPVYLP